ncbi:MAG TPA: hypothetical protein VGU61_17060 [Noviherbaspirillum sp.]|nr:hypothetical protein [Noviherbaspirillum sp.]
MNTYRATDLTAYTSRGGKIMFIHGIGDLVFSFNDTADYYKRLVNAAGDRFPRQPDGSGQLNICAMNEKSLRNGRLQGLSVPAKAPDFI